MSDAASMIAKTAFQQSPDQQTHVKSQNSGGDNKRSFDDVMQNQQNQAQTGTQINSNAAQVGGVSQSSGVSGRRIDQLQFDLTNRISEMGAGQAPTGKGDILPEMLYSKGRMGMLKEALGGVNQMPQGKELMSRFTHVEKEYNQLESIMKSNKDLSPGELLGLQARLYQVSQHIEVMSKVVDQITGGLKTILNTSV